MTEITMRHFSRPDGRSADIEVVDISPIDAAWFKANNVKLSSEDDTISGGYILYADVGATEPGDETTPLEVIYLSPLGERCCTAMANLRAECEKFLTNLVTTAEEQSDATGR